MRDIINISKQIIGEIEVNSVNGREIYTALEIKQDFSSWMKKQLKVLGLEENVDYITLTQKRERQILKEYIITLDTAKHIAMASRTAKGKEIRNYFIQIEKEFLSKNCTGELKPNLDYQGGKVAHILHGYNLNPSAFLNVKLINKFEQMFGSENTRKFYSELTGIEVGKDTPIIQGDHDIEVKTFIDECIEIQSDGVTLKTAVYYRYTTWAKSHGIANPLHENHFYKIFKKYIKQEAKQMKINGELKRAYRFDLKGSN